MSSNKFSGLSQNIHSYRKSISFGKRIFFVSSFIFIAAAIYFYIWLTAFEGFQVIRFQCYRLKFCSPLSQILENGNLSRLPDIASILDQFYLFFPVQSSPLPIYQLKVDPKNYQSIVNQLPAPYSAQFRNTPSPKISGVLSYGGKDYKIDINFRGIGAPHWSEQKKSLRLSIKSGETLNGLDQVDLLIPSESNYYGFFLNKWSADHLGLHTNDPSLVHVYLNNRDYGPFVRLNRWDQSFLERRGLQNGLIFGDIDPFPGQPLLYKDIESWKIFDPLPDAANDFSAIEKLLTALNLPDSQASFSQLKQIIDIDSFVRWEALAVFFNTRHQDDFHNIRLFLNPVSGKLQFMPVDFGPQLVNNHPANKTILNIDYNPLVTRLLQDPDIYQARNDVLQGLINNREFQNKLWQQYDELYFQTRGDFYRDPLDSESNLRFTWVVHQLKSQTQKNIVALKKLLSQ